MKIWVLLALFLLPMAYAVDVNLGSVDSNYNYLHVRTLKYEPYPVTPGQYADLWINLENTGQEKVDVQFTLLPVYPFSIDAYETANRTVSSLAGKQTALLHYKIRVDSRAIEGSNLINYKWKTSDGLQQQSSLNIFVETSDANVAVDSVSANQISPGEIADVTLQLTNEGDSPLTNIAVNLDLSSTNIPIAPVNSTSEKKLYLIEPHQTVPLTFQLLALPDASSTTYKVPIQIKFIDGTGKNYTKSSLIGLTVGVRPDIGVTTTESTIYNSGETGNVVLKLTNKGLSDIKLLNVVLNASSNYDIISGDSMYVGKISSDDYETAQFRIQAKRVKNGVVPLLVTLDYRDANNKRYLETKIVNLKVVSAQLLGVPGSSSGYNTLVFAIVFIVACFFLYRRWEKKKKASKK